MKKIKLVWSISLIVIVIVSVLYCFAGSRLPDALIRILGVLDLCAIVVLAYTSVKMRSGKF